MIALILINFLTCTITLLPYTSALSRARASAGTVTSTFVFFDAHGNLQYKADPQGNRIMDFSNAGYGGGGVPIPYVPTTVTISPSGKDDTASIQNALSKLASAKPDANGLRGAVLLKPGNFKVSKTVRLTTSGVVLRGSGAGSNGTVITMTGPAFLLFSMSGSGTYKLSNQVSMTDDYVPSGAASFNVSNPAGYEVGGTILIHKPVTEAWVHFLGMDKLTRNGQHQTWIAVGKTIDTDRVITAISGNQITIDAPLTDSFDAKFLKPPGGSVSKYVFPGRISLVGIESLSIVAPNEYKEPPYKAIDMNNIIDSWVDDVHVEDTESSISIAQPRRAFLLGTQLLFNNCSVLGNGGTWPFSTQAMVTGPNVLLNCHSDDNGAAPHQRWASALLVDNSTFPQKFGTHSPGIAFSDRKSRGSGHGWTLCFSVAWNVVTQTMLVQQPPGTLNWVIGGNGTETLSDGLPNGIYEQVGKKVTPVSLYLAQLKQRLGSDALTTIGYADVDGNPLEDH